MNISDSALFKDYARPILQAETMHSSRGRSSSGIMDSVIQYLMNRAKLEVSQIRISNASESSFDLSIECRVTGTGPLASTLSPMELDITFNNSVFGQVKLPEIRTSFWGTRVVIKEQTINITDMATYDAFIRSILVNDETNFELENGECTIRSLGLTANCDYSLDIPIVAMGGPRMSLRKLSRSGDEGIAATFRVNNPSPVELEHGTCEFELRNDKGERLAELRGELKIVRGQFDLVLQGRMLPGVVPSDKARLVGVGVEGALWRNVTVRHVDVVVDVPPKLVGLLR